MSVYFSSSFLRHYDEKQTLLKPQALICAIGADGEQPEPKIVIRIRANGENAVIYIDDNGPGVKEEFAENIFDVGFSLKSDGTGLGLNIAREALARSGGTLAYHLDFKDGARFEIGFPRVR